MAWYSGVECLNVNSGFLVIEFDIIVKFSVIVKMQSKRMNLEYKISISCSSIRQTTDNREIESIEIN